MSPHTSQPPICAPQSALCAVGAAAGGDVGPSVTLSPLGCPQGVPLSPRCPHTPPSPQPVPHGAPCVQWVPPVVMWGPVSHCHHQGVLIPMSPRRPIVPTMSPLPPAPNLCPMERPMHDGCHWWRCGALCHIVTLGLSPTPPHCPHGVPLSPRSPPSPQPPISAPWIAPCAMGAAGGDVGPGVTLSPSGFPHPHCPHDVHSPPAPDLCPTECPVCDGCHWW